MAYRLQRYEQRTTIWYLCDKGHARCQSLDVQVDSLVLLSVEGSKGVLRSGGVCHRSGELIQRLDLTTKRTIIFGEI